MAAFTDPVTATTVRSWLTFWAIGALLAASLYVVGLLAHVLLIAFVAIMLAVLIESLSRPMTRWLHLPNMAAVLSTCLLLLGIVIGVGFLLGPRIAEQVSELRQSLPKSVQTIKSWVHQQGWLAPIIPSRATQLFDERDIAGRLTTAFSTAAGTLTGLFVVLFASIYLAMQPRLYMRVLLRLVPPARRERGEDILRTLAQGLRLWLLGRVAAMTLVALLTGVGLWLLNVQLALTLALLAGLLAFVPFIGPVLSAIPAVLISLLQGPQQALYIAVLYTAVQLIENNLLTPIAQRKAVSLPPAALLIAQLAATTLFGFLGLLMATPLTVVGVLLVQLLYIREGLADKVPLLTEQQH